MMPRLGTRHRALPLVVCAVALLVPSFAVGHVGDDGGAHHGARQDARRELREERAQAREERQELQQEQRMRIRAHVRERITAHFRRVVARLQAAIDRLTRLSDRIEGRVNVLAEEGEDVSSERALLGTARGELGAARTALDVAVSSFSKIPESEHPREVFREVRTQVRVTVQHLKDAHATLVRVITTIRGLRQGATAQPSPNTP